MVSNKKLKGKHRQPKTTNLFVPPAAPKQPVPKKYGLDYSRFDVDSDDSDAERQALAAPDKLRTGRAAPPDPTDVRDLERELGAHVSSLSAAEALSAARAAEREMDKLRRQLQMTAKVSTKKASQRESAARRAIAEARAELEAAQREAADARAKAVEAAESVSKRSSDVEAAQRRAKELGEKCKAATAAIDPEQLKAGLSPDAPSVQPPAKEVSYDGTIDVTSTRFAGREVALTISLQPLPDEDAGFVVTLRDAEHLEEEPLASEYVEEDLKISLSESTAACAHYRRQGDKRAATRSTCPSPTVLSCRLETRTGTMLCEAPRVVRVDWAAKDAAVWAAPSTAAPPLSPAAPKAPPAASATVAPPKAPSTAAPPPPPKAAAAVGGFASKANRQALARASPPAAPPVAAPAPPPAPPKPADPPTPPAPAAAKTKKPPYTFAGGRVEHLPGIRTFVLTLPDGRGELSVDGDRVELASQTTRETLRLPAQLEPNKCQASKVKQDGTKFLRVRLPYSRLRRVAPGARDAEAATVVFADHGTITEPPVEPACRACSAQLAPRREATARVRDGDLEPDEVAAALSCDTAQPVLQSASTIPLEGERFVGRCSVRLCGADASLLKIGAKTLEAPRGFQQQCGGRLARRLACKACGTHVGYVFGGSDAALYRHRLLDDDASAPAFVASLLAREASASNATAFRLVSGSSSLGVRVLATGGHAAALGAASPNSVVALASTLSCSFRRDVAPASTLLDVALEADELAAVAADLEAAKSGAADGAWALATWAPAGFADAVGGF